MPNRNFWWFVEEEGGNGEINVFIQASPRKTDNVGERFVCLKSKTKMPMVDSLQYSDDSKISNNGEVIFYNKVRIYSYNQMYKSKTEFCTSKICLFLSRKD